MLLFKVCGKTKYALAAICLHAQLNALLTLREAHSLRRNRTINLKDGIERNQAIDQVMEHNIKETKELMYAHELTQISVLPKSIAGHQIQSKKLFVILTTKLICRRSLLNTRGERMKTFFELVTTLQRVNALKEIPGRTYQGTGTLPKDPISALNFKDLSIWINKHKKTWVNPYQD